MALSVSELEKLIPEKSGNFVIGLTGLGIEETRPLFDHFTEQKIALSDATGDRGKLQVTGQAKFSGTEKVPVGAQFFAADGVVTGLRVGIGIPDWKIKTNALDLKMTAMEDLGLDSPRLVLTAAPDANKKFVVRARVHAEFPVLPDDAYVDFDIVKHASEPGWELSARWQGELLIGGAKVAAELGFYCDTTGRRLVIAAGMAGVQAAYAAYRDDTSEGAEARRMVLFALEPFAARGLPLVGDLLTNVQLPAKDIRLGYATSTFSAAEITRVNQDINELFAKSPPAIPPPRFPAGDSLPGFGFAVTLTTKEGDRLVAVHAGEDTRSKPIPIDHTLGPVRLRDVTIAYEKGIFWLLFTADLQLGSVDVGVRDFGVGVFVGDSFTPYAKLGAITLKLQGGTGIEFLIGGTFTGKAKRFVGVWKDPQGLDLATLAGYFGVPLDDVPESMRPTLHTASISYDQASSLLVLTAQTDTLDVVFASVPKAGGGHEYVLHLRDTIDVKLSQLPVFGRHVTEQTDLSLTALGLILAPKAGLDATRVGAINQAVGDVRAMLDLAADPAITKRDRALPDLPTGRTLTGPYFTVDLVDAAKKPHSLLVGRGGPQTDTDPEWIAFPVTLGPLSVTRIGLASRRGTPWFMLDATLTLGTTTITARGLGLSLPFGKPGAKVCGCLDALAVTVPGTELVFQVRPAEGGSGISSVIRAAWQDRQGLPGDQVLAAFGVSAEGFPQGMLPDFREVGLVYDTAAQRFLVTVVTAETKIVLVYEPDKVEPLTGAAA